MEPKKLKRHYFFLGGLKPYDACCKKNIGLAIAMRKFEEFQELFIQAQYSFTMGMKDDHKVFSSDGNNESAQNGIRSYYLKNAIQDYNACYDYILQIVYFGCDFYGKIKSSEDYKKELKKCVWSSEKKKEVEEGKEPGFKQRIDELIKNLNDEFSAFLDKFRKFYEYRTDSRYPLADWTNRLKHKGAFAIDELFIEHGKVEIWNEKTGEMVFSTDYIKPKRVPFLKIKECLTEHNNKIVDYAEYLYLNLGFEDPGCSEKLYTANHPHNMDTKDLKIRGTF